MLPVLRFRVGLGGLALYPPAPMQKHLSMLALNMRMFYPQVLFLYNFQSNGTNFACDDNNQ